MIGGVRSQKSRRGKGKEKVKKPRVSALESGNWERW